MSSVINFTRKEYIKILESKNKYDAIEELASVFDGTEICTDVLSLIQALKEREDIMSTGIGFGIAIPHAKIDSIKEMSFAIGISKKGIEFDSLDGEPVYLVILVAAGKKQHKEYLRLLSQIMAILKKDNIKDKIISSESPEDIINYMNS